MSFWSNVIPSVMSLAGSLFGMGDGGGGGGGRSELEEMRGVQQRMLQPYVEAGQKSIPTLQEQYKQLLSDPGSVMSRIGSGYQRSPGYQYNADAAMRAGNQAASAGGYVGSPAHQEEMARRVYGISNQDYNDYMTRGTNLYGQGLQGEQGMMGTGLSAATGSTRSLNDMLKAQAQLEHQRQQSSLEGMLTGGVLGGKALDIYGQRRGWGNEGKWGQGFFSKQV